MTQLPAAWLRGGRRPRIRRIDVGPAPRWLDARVVDVPALLRGAGRVLACTTGIGVGAMIVAAPTAFFVCFVAIGLLLRS